MKKINEATFKPTLKEPVNKQSKNFENNFKKTMITHNVNLNEIDEMLSEEEVELKKKIFDLSKMESLVFSDPILSAEYEKMANRGEELYGYHMNENILSIIFNNFVLNDNKYLQKYKMAIPKEKKRRDKSGINQLKKMGDIKMKKMGVLPKKSTVNENSEFNDTIEIQEDDCIIESNGFDYTVSCGGKFLGDFGELNDALNTIKTWKQSNKWFPNTWFISDHGNPFLIDDEGNILNETTTAGSAGGAAGYVGYAGPAAWSKKGDLSGDFKENDNNKAPIISKPIFNGGSIISEANYLIDSTQFQKIFENLEGEILNKEQKIDFISNNSDAYGSEVNNMNQNDLNTIDGDLKSHVIDKPNLNNMEENKDNNMKKENIVDETAKSKSQQRFMGMVHAVQKGTLDPDEVSDEVVSASEKMKKKDVKDFASTKHDKLPEKVDEDAQTMLQSDQTMAFKPEPINNQSSGMETGMNSGGGMSENANIFEELNKELEAYSVHQKKLTKMTEDRKPSSLILKDRLGNENVSNFKKDLGQSSIKDIINVEKELQYADQQTEVGKDPQKLGNDIEKTEIKATKGEALQNVGNSTNDKGDEIPKRNFTKEEQNEIDMYRLGQQDLVYDNKPDQRFEDRMKADMGEKLYKQRQDKMEFRAKAPMYNKDSQPTEKGVNSVQFDKEKSMWNEREGLKESIVSGKYSDILNKKRIIDFNLNEVKEITESNDLFELNLEGLGNTYTNKVNLNENVINAINNYKFYTDGKAVFMQKNKLENLSEGVLKEEKPKINKEFDKMKHLLGYKPSNYTNTNNVKKNRGF